MEDEDPDSFHVAFGENDLMKLFEHKQYAEVEAVHRHPDFNIDQPENDIALIQLKRPLNFSRAVQPACLPTEHRASYDGVLKVKQSYLKTFLTHQFELMI